MRKRQVSVGAFPLACVRSSLAKNRLLVAVASQADIFTISNNDVVGKISTEDTMINTLAWNRDNLIALGGENGSIPIIGVEKPAKTIMSGGHSGPVLCCSWDVTGQLLASGGMDEMLCLWEPSQQALPIGKCAAHSDPILGVSFSPDGYQVATGSIDGLIRIWDIRSSLKRCLATIIDDDNPVVSSIGWSPNGKFLITATMDNIVRIWDPTARKCARAYRGTKFGKWGVANFYDKPNTPPQIISGGVNGLVFWNVQNKSVTFQEPAETASEVLDLDYDRCTYNVYTISGKDNIVTIYDDLFQQIDISA